MSSDIELETRDTRLNFKNILGVSILFVFTCTSAVFGADEYPESATDDFAIMEPGGALSADQSSGKPDRLNIAQTVPQATSDGDDGWRFFLTPYLWVPVSVQGTSTVSGVDAPLDFDLSDVLDLFQFALSARGEAWHGDFGFILDGQYVNLGLEDSLPSGGDVDVDIQQAIVDLAASYRFATVPLGSEKLSNYGGYRPWMSFEVLGGGRYNYLKQEIDLGPVPTLGGSETFVELLVGGRIILGVTDRLSFSVRGDASGFGIGNGSDLTWTLAGGLDYRAWDSTSIKIGYRVYDIDYETGSGPSRFGMDARLHGPWLGATFAF